MTTGIPMTPRRPRHLRRADRDHDRRAYATSAEMAGELGPFPGYKENAEEHAAGHAQPPPRAHGEVTEGYEDLSVNPVAAYPCQLPRPGPDRPCHRSLGQGAGARREARLPQRAGHRDRADRHHRPGDGLRHHRHRARLRAGEVQEARRRRLLQDHQPRVPEALARWATPKPRSSRDRGLRRRSRHAGARRPASTTGSLKAKGFTDTQIEKINGAAARPPSTSSSSSTSGRWARTSAPTCSASRRSS
jgi:ribonucleoside-diphosphate reductase alpha chain